MITENNTIEVVTLDKYTWTIYKREHTARFPNCPYAVKLEKATPRGKYSKTKMLENFVYESIEAAEKAIEYAYGKEHKRLKERAQRAAEKRKAQAELKASDHYAVGDIIYNSWGYEQTNIEFYQVIKVTAKCIKVREIAQDMVEGSMYSHGMAWNVVPCKDEFTERAREYMLKVKPEGYLSAPESYYYMKKWDGSPKYVSSYY